MIIVDLFSTDQIEEKTRSSRMSTGIEEREEHARNTFTDKMLLLKELVFELSDCSK